MAQYNIYLDAHVSENGLGGWALVLTNSTGFKELSHHIGVIENCTEEDLLLKALEETLVLATTGSAPEHHYVVNIRNHKVAAAYLNNRYDKLSKLKQIAPHVLVISSETNTGGYKFANVLSQHAYKFYLAGGMRSNSRSKVTVTEATGGR